MKILKGQTVQMLEYSLITVLFKFSIFFRKLFPHGYILPENLLIEFFNLSSRSFLYSSSDE